MKINLDEYVKVTDYFDIQNMLRDLMQEVHLICEEHNLTYNLFAGTLLGAVRHGDIIPWDDDIDITMPRPDYDRFREIVLEKYSDKFNLCSYPMDNYIYEYMKFCNKDTVLTENLVKDKYNILGVFIDIFPIDGVPEDSKIIDKMYKNVMKNKRKAILCTYKNAMSPVWRKKPYFFVRMLQSAIYNIKGYKYYIKKQIDEATKYPFETSERVGLIEFGTWCKKGIVPKREYLDRKKYKFGQYEFWGVADAHKCLTTLYGDYMTPPPEEKRIPKHNFDLYIKKR